MNTTKSYERYNRQIILKGFGEEGQRKLTQAKVLVIGAGGLGCPALQYLTAAGVGTVGVVDDDVISVSNLHRQVLYATADVSAKKAEVAAAKLSSLNPGVIINVYPFRLDVSNAFQTITGYDVVIDGTDNFASRYLINDACVLLNKPLVYGAVSQYEGQVALFNATDKTGWQTNYRDLFPEPPEDGEVLNCAEAGVLGVLPGIIGTMQAAEAIKFICGIGEPLVNKLLTYNVLTNQLYEVGLMPSEKKDKTVPKTEADFLAMDYAAVCGSRQSSIKEIDADELKTLMQQPSSVVIDVREIGERPLLNGLPHRQLPMSMFAEKIEGITEETVVLVCQHGIRSLLAGEMLQEKLLSKKKIFSLKGGIAKWAAALGVG